MKEIKIEIKNQAGLHARAAALLVQNANMFDSDIIISKGDNFVNGKSIMGVMTLAATCGSIITISANGIDEDKALETMALLIDNKFGEGI